VRGGQVSAARIGSAVALIFVLGIVGIAGALSPPIVQKGKLQASDQAASDRFGESVAISGSTIVVAAPGDDPAGAVYVFKRPVQGWANGLQVAKLTPSDGTQSIGFGDSVAIDGDTIVVGAPFDGAHGSAYAFERPAGGWSNATENGKLTPSGNTAFDFGRSVAVSGDSALIGATTSTVNGHPMQGAAYAFVRPTGGWTDANESGRLTASTGAENDYFGRCVAIDGDTAVVGAPGRNVAGNTPNRGAVYVFVAPSGADTWTNDSTPNATLVASEGATSDFLGYSVAVSGSTLVAGAMQDKVGSNSDQGSGYLFERPSGGWSDVIESAHLIASDGGAQDRLGWSAAIEKNSVVLGAPIHDVGSTADQGAAYLFNKPAGGWMSSPNPLKESAELLANDGGANDRLGAGVGVSTDTIAAGATGNESAYAFGQPKKRSHITLGIAETNRRIKARGRVKPSRPGERVVVTLFRKGSGRFHKLASKHPHEGATGRYRAAFKRPAPGLCKISARYLGDARTKASHASKRFSCALR
jgi:hypothetical protein